MSRLRPRLSPSRYLADSRVGRLVPALLLALILIGGLAPAASGASTATDGRYAHQEWSTAATYQWRARSSSAAYGGSYTQERHLGARALFQFSGTSVTWYTIKGPDQGIARVYVDGVLKSEIDQYAATRQFRVARRFEVSGSGAHTLAIVVSGRRRAASTGTWIAVDAFRDTLGIHATPAAVYRWPTASVPRASGGAYVRSTAGGASATFRFSGTRIDWYTLRGPNEGRARVYIDGVWKATVDNYRSTATYGARIRFSGLAAGTHTLRIVVAGTRSAASGGVGVVIDRWVVPPSGRLVFGLGPEAPGALDAPLLSAAPVRMLSNWYNGPGDLEWMALNRRSTYLRAYANGRPLHLLVFTGGADTTISTAHGTACGRPYPLSARFPDDMRRLARIFAGTRSDPPLYVTLFTEFQTYPCTDNGWNPDRRSNAYLRALKDRYREAKAIFHRYAPNSAVSLGWGGWQWRWDVPATGSGRSMFRYFADVMRESDFQSFQSMQSDGNIADVREMTRILGAYGPVLQAHYKPGNGSVAVLDRDLRTILTGTYIADVTRKGLFAFSFMDDSLLDDWAGTYDFVVNGIRTYAR